MNVLLVIVALSQVNGSITVESIEFDNIHTCVEQKERVMEMVNRYSHRSEARCICKGCSEGSN